MTGHAGHNVVALLQRVADRTPDRTALVFPGRTEDRPISFAALWERVRRCAGGLSRVGLQPGDRAVVMVPMSGDLYVALLGILAAGGIAVFVDPWIGAGRIAAFAAYAEPAAFVGVPRSHLLRWAHRRLRRIRLTVTTGRRLCRLPAAWTLAEIESCPPIERVHPASPADSALITFTTGSSGDPKGADRTQGFLAAQHRALAAEFPYRDDDVDMPMFPVFALNNLAAGITSVIPRIDFRRVDRADADVLLEQMQRWHVTTCTASPPLFDRLAERLSDRGSAPPRLRRIATGGAPVTDRQLMRWRQVFPGAEILVVYGSTEAEPVAHIDAESRAVAESDRHPLSPGYCIGRPVQAIRARVIRIHDGPVSLGEEGWSAWELPPGEVGELVVSGQHVCRGYYRNPVAVAENKIIEPQGTVWHRMGDTGYFDGSGRFWVAGRVHSTIRRDGVLVHPQLLEQAACGADDRIRRAAAVGLPDPALGERVVLVLETEAAASVEAVRDRLRRARLPMDEIRTRRDPLPVDPRHNSKVDYRRLKSELSGGHA